MATTWDDPRYKEKPERRKKRSAQESTEPSIIDPMMCNYCELPYAIREPEHCKCPPWTVGKLKEEVL